jgi:hypothetical protein
VIFMACPFRALLADKASMRAGPCDDRLSAM